MDAFFCDAVLGTLIPTISVSLVVAATAWVASAVWADAERVSDILGNAFLAFLVVSASTAILAVVLAIWCR